jgi:hypothetical protein
MNNPGEARGFGDYAFEYGFNTILKIVFFVVVCVGISLLRANLILQRFNNNNLITTRMNNQRVHPLLRGASESNTKTTIERGGLR